MLRQSASVERVGFRASDFTESMRLYTVVYKSISAPICDHWEIDKSDRIDSTEYMWSLIKPISIQKFQIGMTL